jgi:FKBP-type peptidyl-prolyl cis-trans isomerase SlyD
MIPGLEKLTGMKVGGEKNVRGQSQRRLRQRSTRKHFKKCPRKNSQPMASRTALYLRPRLPTAAWCRCAFHEIKENTVVMDMNHPMAGKTFDFNVKVVNITATAASAAQPAKPAGPAKK